MKLSFYGAAQTVTGSMHLVEVNGSRLLLDCGMYQGRRKESIERNRRFPFDVTSIDAVVLSHAHIDHSGNLPNLVIPVEHAAGIKNSAEYIFLVHDEDKGALPLKEKLRENHVKHVYYPAMDTSVEL